MGKVHVGDLLRIGHKLWYRVGCGPGMPGPYGVAVGWVGGIGKVARAACMPPLRIIRLVGDMGDYIFNIGCRALWKALAICSLL